MADRNKINVLIIGGTGITSTDVSKLALKSKDINLYLLNRGKSPSFIGEDFKCIKADINYPHRIMRSKFKGMFFDVVCDFISYKKEELLHKLQVFDGICKQYIFVSSCSVFRDNYKTSKIKTEENTPKGNLLWSYGWEKYLCEEMLKQIAKDRGFAYTIVRPSVTCDDRYFINGWTLNGFESWTFVDRLIKRKPLIMPDGGEQLCSFLHSKDFAAAMVSMFGNINAYNEDYNITGSEYLSYKDAAIVQAELLGVAPKFIDIPAEECFFYNPDLLESGLMGKIMSKSLGTCFDSRKAKEIIPDFEQRISVRRMTERAIEFYKRNPKYRIVNPFFNKMFDEMSLQKPLFTFKAEENELKYLLCFFSLYLKKLYSRFRKALRTLLFRLLTRMRR